MVGKTIFWTQIKGIPDRYILTVFNPWHGSEIKEGSQIYDCGHYLKVVEVKTTTGKDGITTHFIRCEDVDATVGNDLADGCDWFSQRENPSAE
jgi:hypothetical protein